MATQSLGSLQIKINKLENKIVQLQDLVIVRKEKFRRLQTKYNNLEKNMDKIIEQTVNKEVEKAVKQVHVENEQLKLEVARLKGLLNMNSTNSGISTSKTPINQKKHIPNSRKKSDKKIGGQPGHKKNKLNAFTEEEITEKHFHELKHCICGGKLDKIGEKIKDELELEIIVKKIEHHFCEYICTCCGKKLNVPIPVCLKEENQYGTNVQALAVSLLNEGCVSYNRTRSLIKEFSGNEIDLSEGFLVKLQKKCADGLDIFINDLKRKIINEKVISWDDTVIMVNQKQSCLRFYGTPKLALYTAHKRKNKEGIDEDNILNQLTSDKTVIHDHNTVNYNKDYNFQNAECCVHLLRDLKKVKDNLNHKWVENLSNLLIETNIQRKECIEIGKDFFEEDFVELVSNKYDECIKKGKAENKIDRSKYYGQEEKALLNRLSKYKENYLLWVTRFDIDFSNNLSERSLRFSKTKMKVSGQFQNIKNAEYYSKICSYIETCKRNGIDVHNAIKSLLEGNPLLLENILKEPTC